MFSWDARDREAEADRSCIDCGRPITRGMQCTACWIATEGLEEHGGEG